MKKFQAACDLFQGEGKEGIFSFPPKIHPSLTDQQLAVLPGGLSLPCQNQTKSMHCDFLQKQRDYAWNLEVVLSLIGMGEERSPRESLTF